LPSAGSISSGSRISSQRSGVATLKMLAQGGKPGFSKTSFVISNCVAEKQ
jgi:hypothetical protein